MEKIENQDGSYAIWRESNTQRYLEIYAFNHYDLGFLESKFLSKRIHIFKDLIEILALKYITKRHTYQKFISMAQEYEKFIPKYLRQEMQGMADALENISYEDILLQNCFLDILYGQLIPMNNYDLALHSYDFGCTSFGVINQNSTLTGQNFDLAVMFKPTLTFALIKMPNKPDIFSLRTGALLSLPVGRNSYGVALNVNVVKNSMKGAISIPCSIKARLAFEKGNNAEISYHFIISTPSPTSGNLLIADESKIIALEILPFEYKREDVTNTIVRSNTFTSDSSQKYLIKPKYSKKRQRYAEKQINEAYNNNKGLTDDGLLNLLADHPIICRMKYLRSKTIAFNTKLYFGLGNPYQNKPGIIPLKQKNKQLK
ncbi:MAG: C45 family autoproteolytic acyltransferase/hydrolase [Promethearchaeota archaeon]